MSAPTKDNAHIRSNPEAFQEAYERARELFGGIEGVAGVAFGQKKVAGLYNDQLAIVVFVKEKKDESELPPEQRIPVSFEGYPTDVRIVRRGTAEGCDNTTRYDKIQGGIQIMVQTANGYGKGTLGCIVKKRGDKGRENVYLLSNKHVLYSPGKGSGTAVRHPTESDSILGPVQAGGLYGNFPSPTSNSPKYFVDAAIAKIDLDSCCGCTKDTTAVEENLIVDLQLNGVNSIGDVRSVINDQSIIFTNDNPRKVFKVGRTTGKTTGKVMLINAPLDADPPPDVENGAAVSALNTIVIEFDVTSTANGLNCKGQPRFTDDGDSGSIVLDENNRVIGLHTHRGVAGADGLIPSHACHILPVLDHLGICIPVTTGTSHGSSKATDGSGLESYFEGLGPGDFEVPDGEIGFASRQLQTVPATAVFPAPTLSSDDEAQHMYALLDALRETEKGRGLHDTFGQIRREIGYLVRNCRPVKVAWHRNQGPAFFAHVLNHLRGHADEVPREVRGVSRETLLNRLTEELSKNGSNSLRRAIEEYSDDFKSIASFSNVHEGIDWLRDKENP